MKLWMSCGEAVSTTLYYFYQAFWAFCLGYFVSSMIQVFVTRERMRRVMGKDGTKSVALGAFFGFISSSCSFAALATTKTLLKKGAGLIPAMAFLLASTNLVIELGIVITVFLSWQFVIGEYLGGLLLILIVGILIKVIYPKKLIKRVRERLQKENASNGASDDSPKKFSDSMAWSVVGRRYFMEWKMVWKDVTFGFTVAGIIATMVPTEFFQTLFPGSGSESLAWYEVIAQTFIGPLAAFFTFIGSMGNIPLAAVLYQNGVSFAGIMAFIFSDLMVFPVLRINAKYYGWKMAFYIMGLFCVALLLSALILHFGFEALDILPKSSSTSTQPSHQLSWNYTAFLNLFFLALTCGLAFLAGKKFWLQRWKQFFSAKNKLGEEWMERILSVLAVLSLTWISIGVLSVLFKLG